MTPTRTGFAALLVAAGLAVGCGGGSTAPDNRSGSSTKASSKDDPADGAVVAAIEFLNSVFEGKADPAKLTPAFKKVVTDPAIEAEKAQGYSDWAAGLWLKELAGKVTPGTRGRTTGVAVDPSTVIVTSAPPDGGKVGRAVLRMAKVGDRWLVDWVHTAPPGSGVPLTGSGDQLARTFAATAFLDTALTREARLTEAVLTLAAKSRLAPPLGDPIGYNRGVLGVKLANFRGDATGYKGTLGTQTADLVTGTLVGGAERPFTLKRVKGPNPGEWLVDDFQPH
jgi:hypothetical protein